ncbi:GNAT family N-acetyltransferase [Leptolyngbya sp. NK1-12]|uniref:GNAT family N-acetyltransferase n=1 Tax=Leptolyngbya sp. NK1-12 TaxID=2547451 RepID=A0AA96WD10_9CYAN|nr:GNAT family N-acetyltransferase [Leptolyngbya sp. NK1-12]
MRRVMKPEFSQSTPIMLRVASLADAESLSQLCTQLGYTVTVQQMQQHLAAVLSHPDHQVYVAEQHRVVGWIHGQRCALLIGPTQVVILGLVVDETVRGTGIGRQLLHQLEAWAMTQGCSEVMVRSNVVRQQAHRFYERMGYRMIKQSLVFQKRLQPPNAAGD